MPHASWVEMKGKTRQQQSGRGMKDGWKWETKHFTIIIWPLKRNTLFCVYEYDKDKSISDDHIISVMNQRQLSTPGIHSFLRAYTLRAVFTGIEKIFSFSRIRYPRKNKTIITSIFVTLSIDIVFISK